MVFQSSDSVTLRGSLRNPCEICKLPAETHSRIGVTSLPRLGNHPYEHRVVGQLSAFYGAAAGTDVDDSEGITSFKLKFGCEAFPFIARASPVSKNNADKPARIRQRLSLSTEAQGRLLETVSKRIPPKPLRTAMKEHAEKARPLEKEDLGRLEAPSSRDRAVWPSYRIISLPGNVPSSRACFCWFL